jgi:hypothetical protein
VVLTGRCCLHHYHHQAMSETLQENEALMCEKSSMQALNAQLSAEIEGGSRWIDEQRAMHKELSRVRRELSYEVRAHQAHSVPLVCLECLPLMCLCPTENQVHGAGQGSCGPDA